MKHTVIVSDLHITEGELGKPGRALWKRYKRPKFFIDRSFRKFLLAIESEAKGLPVELVLNGDIFDFDAVTRVPEHTRMPVSLLERGRGLHPEEEKSEYKMEVILSDHPTFVHNLRDFIKRGHTVVFVIGNHDIEMHWPKVQHCFRRSLELTDLEQERLTFCEWFYVSENDTMIEHGNQYDDYCVAQNPIHPWVKIGSRVRVRLPFGNYSSRYMVNAMGLFNPHAESSFLMSLREYISFFFKYARIQPSLPFTWIYSATITFWAALMDGLLPAMRDPLFIEQRVEDIAARAKSTPQVVRMLRELHTHPAIFNPIKIARELWLDRVFLLLLIAFLSFQVYLFFSAFVFHISFVWWFAGFVFLIPTLNYYARNIQSEIFAAQDEAIRQAPMIAKICGVQRVVFGHTHRPLHTSIDHVEVLNSGTWSPAFKDPECTQQFTQKCFVWIKPDQDKRTAGLYVWKDAGLEPAQGIVHGHSSHTS